MKRYYKMRDINGDIFYYKEIVPKVRYKIMYDENGRHIMSRLVSYETEDGKYNLIKLIIIYLDDYSYRAYTPFLFSRNDNFLLFTDGGFD